MVKSVELQLMVVEWGCEDAADAEARIQLEASEGEEGDLNLFGPGQAKHSCHPPPSPFSLYGGPQVPLAAQPLPP